MQDFFRIQAVGSNKRARTRNLLIDSAIGVFAEKGIEEASVSEITGVAGLANGTFYNHFKDKDDLSRACANAIALEIAQRLDVRMSDLERGVSRVVVGSWSFLHLTAGVEAWAHMVLAQYHRAPDVNAPAFAFMRSDIERAVAQQEVEIIADDLMIEQIVAVMMAALRRLLTTAGQEVVLRRTCESILRLLGLTRVVRRRRSSASRVTTS